jgi:hypothetical protein
MNNAGGEHRAYNVHHSKFMRRHTGPTRRRTRKIAKKIMAKIVEYSVKKAKIVEYSVKNPSMKYQDVLEWAKEEFKLGETPRVKHPDSLSIDKVKPSVRQAITWTKDAGNEVGSRTIINCWNKIGIALLREVVVEEDVISQLSSLHLDFPASTEIEACTVDELVGLSCQLMFLLKISIQMSLPALWKKFTGSIRCPSLQSAKTLE